MRTPGFMQSWLNSLFLVPVFTLLVLNLSCEPGGSDVQATPGSIEVTDEEVQNARAALLADPTFSSLTEARPWEVLSEVPNLAEGGRKIGMGLIVELAAPVDSEGPWKQVRCQGTVSEEYRFLYKGVSTLGAGFDDEGRRLVSLRPLPSASMSFDKSDVARQPTQRPCPRGLEDKEN